MSDDIPQSREQLRAGYVGAVDHYTSPQRRDPVKRLWEEPELVRVLDDALARTPSGPVRVLDVGCGTGVALELLRSSATYTADVNRRLLYTGVDLDDALLSVATNRNRVERDGEQLTFTLGDIRDGSPVSPVDLIVSSGVPFSHLTVEQFTDTLTRLFTLSRESATPVVAVLDVLGRFSLEWIRMWDVARWSYRMSFFASDREADATDMTSYDAATLTDTIQRAADAAGVALTYKGMTDRSLMVGRHTMTGEYTPDLPQWRTLINALHDNVEPVRLEELKCSLTLPDAPQEVTTFFAGFIQAWNGTIDKAIRSLSVSQNLQAWQTVQPQLFDALKLLEWSRQPGLGVGHSLTAVVVVAPKR